MNRDLTATSVTVNGTYYTKWNKYVNYWFKTKI